MIIFKRKGIITIEVAQLLESNSSHLLSEILIAPSIFPVTPEIITEAPSRFEVAEEEVAQYVEDGYIKGVWTDEDIIFLKKHYPTKGRKYCSTHLNRNETSVQKKINSLGVKKKKKK